jgi:hypothetical protein
MMGMGPIGKLAEALSKVQGQIKGAVKDATNPAFKGSKYADLASVWEACRKPLADNGLSVLQYTRIEACGPVLVTTLAHSSGESIDGVTPLLMGKQDMQALGSAITYARRYGLAAIVGVAPEDDDAQAAVAAPQTAATRPQPAKPAGYDEWVLDFEASADNGRQALAEAWNKAKPEYRHHYSNTVSNETREKLRAKAEQAAVPA